MSIPQKIDRLAIHVHSVEYTIMCRVNNNSDGIISIMPEIEKVDMFSENDPIVVMYFENGEFRHKGGNVLHIDNDRELSIEITDNSAEPERRIFERYPVSLVISVRKKYQNRRFDFFVANVGYTGLCAISSYDLDIDEQVDMDLILANKMFFLSGRVLWKSKIGNDHEYGIKLADLDKSTAFGYQKYLQHMKNAYLDMYNSAR